VPSIGEPLQRKVKDGIRFSVEASQNPTKKDGALDESANKG